MRSAGSAANTTSNQADGSGTPWAMRNDPLLGSQVWPPSKLISAKTSKKLVTAKVVVGGTQNGQVSMSVMLPVDASVGDSRSISGNKWIGRVRWEQVQFG